MTHKMGQLNFKRVATLHFSEIVTEMMSLYDADDVVLLEELLVGPRVRSVPEELCAQAGVSEQQCIEEHL